MMCKIESFSIKGPGVCEWVRLMKGGPSMRKRKKERSKSQDSLTSRMSRYSMDIEGTHHGNCKDMDLTHKKSNTI